VISVDLDVSYNRTYSYVLTGTGRRIVRSILVRNTGPESTAATPVAARVRLEAPFAEPVLATWEGAAKELGRPSADAADAMRWDNVLLRPSPVVLGRLEERVQAEIVVELLAGAEVLVARRFPITLLAANDWVFDDANLDSIAAFVLPNDPALAPVLTRARELLASRTGSAATDGYQSIGYEPDRPHHIAEAVYDAIRECGLAYSNPPGSFDGGSQKVRSPERIFQERAATCLDSTVLLAAAFAQAGLNPVIFLPSGHAFVGYFTREDGLAAPVTTTVQEIVTAFEAGRIRAVETTVLGDDTPFGGACSSAIPFFRERVLGMKAMVDVQAAWNSGITPPPAFRSGPADLAADVPPPVDDMAAGGTAGGGPLLPDDRAADVVVDERGTPPRVRQWLNSLLDLSSRNHLLDMRTGTATRSGSRFVEFLMPADRLGTVDDLLFTPQQRLVISTPAVLPGRYKTDGINPLDGDEELRRLPSPLVFPPYTRLNDLPREVASLINQRDADPEGPYAGRPDLAIERAVLTSAESRWQAELQQRLGKLRSLAAEALLSTGTNCLYLALGTVTWSEAAEFRGTRRATTFEAPLYLYPVVIEGGRGAQFSIRLDTNGSVTPNYCLREKLRRPPYNLDLPELEYPDTDEHGIDFDAMIGSIRAKLSAAAFVDFAVQSRCLLGVFEYSTFRLWKDLKDHWRQLGETSDVVRHLVYTPNDPYTQAPAPETGLEPYVPIEADDSQIQAIQWALDGRSFRLEGPPGTGKTQTITNLIASSMAHGRTILFVAEKQTALQQVKKRLHAVGLGDYCLELHAKGDSDARLRKTITEQVRQAIEADAVLDNRVWDDLLFKVRNGQRGLDQYRDALHDRGEGGISYWDAREMLVRLGEGPSIAVPPGFVADFDVRWPRLREAAAELDDAARLVGDVRSGAWRLVDGSAGETVDWAELGRTVRAMRDAAEALAAASGSVPGLGELTEPGELELLLAGAALRNDGLHPGPAAFDGAAGGKTWAGEADDVLALVRRLVDAVAPLRPAIGAGVLGRGDLEQLRQLAEEAGDANFLRRRRRLGEFRTALGADALAEDDRVVLEAFNALLGNEALYREVVVGAERLHITVPAGWAPLAPTATEEFEQHLRRVGAYLSGAAASPGAGAAARWLAAGGVIDGATADALSAARDSWARFGGQLRWTADSCRSWLAGRALVEAWTSSLSEWEQDGGTHDRFLSLQRWLALCAAADRLAELGLPELRRDVLGGSLLTSGLAERVQRGAYRAVLALRAADGDIDRFDGAAHDRQLAVYDRNLSDLRELMKQRLPALAVAVRSKADAQELLRELRPVRGERTPVRSLLAKHGETLTGIMPCFLMSPDSVADLLPVGAVVFDLVVFDEASQVRTANAVGALGRGRAAIVVGDSKQMPPTAAFSANSGRFVDGDEDVPDEPIEGAEEIETGEQPGGGTAAGQAARDVESILQEFEASRLPSMQLRCHYRSRDELLIAFSNAEVYETPMLTFPSRAGLESKALSFHRVDGQFIRTKNQVFEIKGTRIPATRTNPAEAVAVAQEILARLKDPERRRRRAAGKRTGAESIIVVTFNRPQMELIETLLRVDTDDADRELVEAALTEEKDDETGVQLADAQLKIRNLENVQGDEAETVIFSVAFSKLAAGESKRPSNRVPLNFGPVTNEGGHRRLNVAVTRAQNEMLVFCSFDPSDLEIKDNTSEGARLLQKFLQLAKDGPRRSGSVGIAVHHSAHIDDVATAVQQMGYRTQTQLGLSTLRVDIAVGRPGLPGWDVAVMLDGPQWAGRGTAYQRELLPEKVLTRLGWLRVVRVWLPSWIHDRAGVLDAIRIAVEHPSEAPPLPAPPAQPDRTDVIGRVAPPQRSAGPDAVPSVPPAAVPPPFVPAGTAQPVRDDDPDEVSTEPAQPGAPVVDGAAPAGRAGDFVAFQPRVVADIDLLRSIGDPAVARLVQDSIREVLEAEAPIEVGRLARAVGRMFGLQRVREQTARQIISLLDPELVDDGPLGRTAWASSVQRAHWQTFRPSATAERDVTEVPYAEWVQALRHVRLSGVSDREETIRAVAQTFGIRRIGGNIRAHLNAVIDHAEGPGPGGATPAE